MREPIGGSVSRERPWRRYLGPVGFALMLFGALDPLEGSLLIVPGSALVALGAALSDADRSIKRYRLAVFVLIAVGVAALLGLSAVGGFGPPPALSMAWGVLVLPYLVGFVLGVAGPDSPRWVLWLGTLVGCWYLVLTLGMSVAERNADPEVGSAIEAAAIALVATALALIGGCAWRLRTARPQGSG